MLSKQWSRFLSRFSHHASAAAFAAAQALAELTDRRARRYPEARKLPFGDHILAPARKTLDGNGIGRARGHWVAMTLGWKRAPDEEICPGPSKKWAKLGAALVTAVVLRAGAHGAPSAERTSVGAVRRHVHLPVMYYRPIVWLARNEVR